MKVICSIAAVIYSAVVFGQPADAKVATGRFKYYVNGSFGFYFSLDAAGAIASRGGATGFQFQATKIARQ